MTTANAEEQLMLELINRARIDPHAEMVRLFNTGQGNSDFAVEFFANNADLLDDGLDNDSYTAADLEALALSQALLYGTVAPLNWNENLATAADAHNDLMIAQDVQSHQLPGEPDLVQRYINAGYDLTAGWAVGENIYGYTQDPLHGHAGFYIDWGFTPTGIQNPAGHRDSILGSQFKEVGIAYKAVPATNANLGPNSVTQNFGYSSNNPTPYLLGVVIDDQDNDDFYDVGEGLSGVTITATGGGNTYTTTSWSAGGYQMEVAPNTLYTVTFSGGGIGQTQTFSVFVAGENRKQDAEAIAVAGPTAGDDTLSGTPGDDTVDLLAGNDVYTGLNGNDSVSGNDDNDSISGQGGDDTLNGDAGNDTLRGGPGTDQINGHAGADKLYGDGNDDFITGHAGNDQLFGSSGNDALNGGDDNDLLQGQGNNDTLNGDGGNDTLLGQAGLDVLDGGSGNDSLNGGGAADTLNGGSGDDTVDGGTERDLISGDAGNDVVIGGGGDDTMSGGADNDTMTGGAGADVVEGDGGADSLSGDGGNDTLDGGLGADTVMGGTGQDLLIVRAFAGGDVLFGGTNTDTFDFESGFGTASIEDFTGVDLIDLQDVFTVNGFGDLTINTTGSTTTVALGGGDVITLNNLSITLNDTHFVFGEFIG